MNKGNNLSNEDKKLLLGFFNYLNDSNYCVVKLSNSFPDVKLGDDIDFVVDNIKKFNTQILDYFKDKNKYNLVIPTKNLEKQNIDITQDNNLVLRLDVTSKKPNTKGLKLKKNYYETIFSNIRLEKYEIEDFTFVIKIPDIKHELLVRIIEYFNYPQKKWHKKYILNNINFYKKNIDFYKKYIDVDIDSLLKKNLFLINLNNFKLKIKNKIKRLIYKSDFIDCIFLFRKKYKKEKPKKIDIGWTDIIVSSSIELPINKIYINLNKSGNIIKSSIDKSPHFEFIKQYNENNIISDKYVSYLFENNEDYSKPDIEEKIKAFIKINNSFKKNKKPYTLVASRDLSLYLTSSATLLDGVHRLSVMKYFNIENIKCYINDIK